MKLKSAFTGQTSISDLQAQKSIQKLLLIKSGAAAFSDELINVSLLDNNGNQNKVISRMKVRDLALIGQYQNGYLYQKTTGTGIESAYIIELTPYGGIELTDNNYLSIDLENLVAASTYEVYGIEEPHKSRAYLQYNSTVITGAESQTKEYRVEDNGYALAIRNNDALSSIRFRFASGGEVVRLPEEIKAIMREANDITLASDSLIEGDALNQTILGGGAEMFFFPLVDETSGDRITSFEITTVGGVDLAFFLINGKLF